MECPGGGAWRGGRPSSPPPPTPCRGLPGPWDRLFFRAPLLALFHLKQRGSPSLQSTPLVSSLPHFTLSTIGPLIASSSVDSPHPSAEQPPHTMGGGQQGPHLTAPSSASCTDLKPPARLPFLRVRANFLCGPQAPDPETGLPRPLPQAQIQGMWALWGLQIFTHSEPWPLNTSMKVAAGAAAAAQGESVPATLLPTPAWRQAADTLAPLGGVYFPVRKGEAGSGSQAF